MLFIMDNITDAEKTDLNAVLSFRKVNIEWLNETTFDANDIDTEHIAKILMIKKLNFRNADCRFQNALVNKYVNDIYEIVSHIVDLTAESTVNYSEAESDVINALYTFKSQCNRL